MGMTIDEIIKKENEIAEDFQRRADTHMVIGNISLEELHCDDTDIEECLQSYKAFADYHNQIAEIMSKYQKIEEIVGNYGFDTSWLCLKKIREVMEDGKK